MDSRIHGLHWRKLNHLISEDLISGFLCWISSSASSLNGELFSYSYFFFVFQQTIDLPACASIAGPVESQGILQQTPREPCCNDLLHIDGDCSIERVPRDLYCPNLVRDLHMAVQGHAADYEADGAAVYQQCGGSYLWAASGLIHVRILGTCGKAPPTGRDGLVCAAEGDLFNVESGYVRQIES